MGPHPAVAAIRLAVRRVLNDVAAQVPDTFTAHPASATTAAGTYSVGATSAAANPAGPYSDAAGSHAVAGGAARAAAPIPASRPVFRPIGDVDPRHGKLRTPRPRPAPDAPLVLVACSGGADSMALAAATAFEAAKLGLRAGAVTVDHGLQQGSTARAVEVAGRLRLLGLDPVDALGVRVGRSGGPEAAARDARYAALDSAADRYGARVILLGHTRDDQAETVLLGLARGSGPRSLSGMPAATGRYRRPFLELDRSITRQACAVLDLPVWDDPHNADPAYTRARVRHEVLPVLEKHLGGGVVDALARTARLFRDDADALDSWAAQAELDAAVPAAVPGEADGLDAGKLAVLPPAVRRRVLRRAAIRAGSPPGDLFARHVEAMDLLVTGWRGQGPLHLPGAVELRRRSGRLAFRRM
ncbi:tRNA lysidine(34) synthetase TilS [Streptacidiphilus sp. EB129]|uniref:tRNA lysidine(34) synthetase TilS n=1 Tax=Streptacidiphilus sp. EB129 TaxID=3156262 RepID=UPI0035119970